MSGKETTGLSSYPDKTSLVKLVTNEGRARNILVDDERIPLRAQK